MFEYNQYYSTTYKLKWSTGSISYYIENWMFTAYLELGLTTSRWVVTSNSPRITENFTKRFLRESSVKASAVTLIVSDHPRRDRKIQRTHQQ